MNTKIKKYISQALMISLTSLLTVACNQDSNEEKPTTVPKESISEMTTSVDSIPETSLTVNQESIVSEETITEMTTYETTISQTTISHESSAEMPSENSYTEVSTSIDANEQNTEPSNETTQNSETTNQKTQLGLGFEEITIEIPNLTKEYTFLWLSDLHIIAGTNEISQDNLSLVQGRIEAFKTSTGIRSASLWSELPDILDSYNADAIFFGGDMIDHASEENILCMKQGTDKLQTPFIYVRADHDLGPFYCKEQNIERVNELHSQIDGNKEVSYIEFDDLCIIGINNSTSQITPNALNEIKELYSKGKPIIIVTHVPLDSLVDTSLSEQSKLVWQNRNLSWGNDGLYQPDVVTQEFLDIVYADDSLIKEVLSGHMHFSWDGQLTENTKEHVFPATANGTIGVIHVKKAD